MIPPVVTPPMVKSPAMRKRFAILVSATMLATIVSTGAQSAGIPVYDATAFAKMVEEAAMLQQQIDQMADAYSKQLEQLDQATQQTGAMTGTRNMGNLLNGENEEAMRYYVPDDMNDLVGIGHANVSASASSVKSNFAGLQEQYKPLAPVDFGDEQAALPGNAAYLQRSNTDHAAMATSQAAYNNAANRMKGYETLLGELNNTQDVKASIDLLARISVENGIVMNELMRLQALQMQLSATTDNHNLTSHRQLHNANKPLPSNQ